MCVDTKRDLGLVEILALHPTTKSRHVSFASKLCHFFIDAERYCIFDTVACETLEQFLGDEFISNDDSRYESFLKNLEALKWKSPELNGSKIDNIALDRFLWLFGLWNRFSKKVAINAEAARIFGNPPQQIIRRLVPRAG
jgi:hypothetical protein